MKILVINTGSSSIKYQLFDMPDCKVLCSGHIERIGEEKAAITHTKHIDGQKDVSYTFSATVADHTVGMKWVADLLTDNEYGVITHTEEVDLVGHRVVHGGEHFSKTMLITDEVKTAIKKLSSLAPLHNPPNLVGIEKAEEVFFKARQAAVFDTAFHQTLPAHAYRYAIPNNLYHDHGVRVYGFHGTSHRYVMNEAAKWLHKPVGEVNLITIHLGNGASMAAIKNGQSIDTTLGLTPLPGLVMGTRSGDIDPGIIFYLNDSLGMKLEDINFLLNKESGMKGLTGVNDLRTISERAKQGDEEAMFALHIYTYRIRKYIGAYLAIIGLVDAIVFTAGVGENSSLIRELATKDMSHLGIAIDENKNNEKGNVDISSPDSAIKVLVIPTNEELEIANQAYALVE